MREMSLAITTSVPKLGRIATNTSLVIVLYVTHEHAGPSNSLNPSSPPSSLPPNIS